MTTDHHAPPVLKLIGGVPLFEELPLSSVFMGVTIVKFKTILLLVKTVDLAYPILGDTDSSCFHHSQNSPVCILELIDFFAMLFIIIIMVVIHLSRC